MRYYPKIVYAIQHNVTKKVYIGVSKDLKARYLSHMYSLRSGKHLVEDLQKDYDKYGEDFSLYVLDEINDPTENVKEYEWIARYKSHIRVVGYNYKDARRVMGVIAKKYNLPLKEGIPFTEFYESLPDELERGKCGNKNI